MKKWVFLALVVGAIGLTWWIVRTYVRVTPPWDQPKYEKVSRGDIRVPITATGLIEPSERIEIKAEASGEVIDVRVKEGDFVRQGDVLVELKKEDEQRNVARAEADVKRVTALLESAKVDVLKAEAAIRSSEARVAELEAQGESTKFELDKVTRLMSTSSSNQEFVNAKSRDDINKAQLNAARAAFDSAESSLESAKQAVVIQEAALEQVKNTFADAKERLDETTLVSRYDALVTSVNVQRGVLVQSGTSGFSLGTPIMTLADVSRLKVVARVDEADYGRVAAISPVSALPDMPGLRERAAQEAAAELERRSGKVTLTVDAFPDQEFTGLIERVEPQGKLPTAATVIQFDVHVQITDDKWRVLPLGVQAQVEFTVESAQGTLRVPADAVKTYNSKRGVWIRPADAVTATEKHPKRFVPCQFGITDGLYTQLVGALGDEKLDEGVEVYTKLPAEPDDDE